MKKVITLMTLVFPLMGTAEVVKSEQSDQLLGGGLAVTCVCTKYVIQNGSFTSIVEEVFTTDQMVRVNACNSMKDSELTRQHVACKALAKEDL